ncbi:hypothetical protein [Enterococcus cecorum]|uniref:hypothetical protein n=1 Tax=Enterococcus cecorum TaxID=44008 RepID=UPI002ACADBA5|nr:hypothetical protein [Enterococcus cecorum]MDZ5589931.1 hypothetical protein [Enterococcus cecorum]
MKVKFKDWNCIVQWSIYYDNNNIAIQLIDEKTKELISVATANTGHENIESTVQIKDYSENEGIWRALVNAGVIEDKVIRTIASGYVEVKVAKLTVAAKKDFEKWLEEWC